MAQFFGDLRDRSKDLDVNMTDQEIDDLKKENNRRLKRAFDDIFKKYNRDFENTGDEIDLEKEEIVVNNGHILHMHHDRDAGKGRRTRRLLTSLATGALWNEDDFDGGFDSLSEEEFGKDAEEGSRDGSEKDADGETEEDSEDDLTEKADRSSISRATSEPSYRTNPTSADDSNATPRAEESDDGFDPLSIDEYSASARRKRLRYHLSTTHIAQKPTKGRHRESIGIPVFAEIPNESSVESSLTTQAVENAPEFDEESDPRRRKKRRTEPILEIPIWTRPDMPSVPIPKTVWDRHWSRRRNPTNRTFDEEGNQICSWKDIQARQRKLRGGPKLHPLMAAKMATQRNDRVADKEQGTSAVEGPDDIVKLEHTCLSEDIASACPACEREARVAADDLSDDEAIIDPEVADAFLKDHTCLSGEVAAPCAACERENETQGNEKEEGLLGVQDSTRGRQVRAVSGGIPSLTKESGEEESGCENCTTSNGDSDSDPSDYDWENNPHLPRPQYVTRIIKYYSKRKPFTPEEDEIMIELVENQAKGWDDVMEAIPGRSRGQLQYRYYTELRSAEWRAKQAAAREANKETKRAEVEKNRKLKEQVKHSIRAVRDLSGAIFEKPLKKADPKWKELIEDEDFRLQPLDPCILPPPLPEEERPSPTFHPTVPLIELASFGDIRDATHLPVWRQAPQLPTQVQGVPMEPIPPLSLLYETPYPNVYPHAQYNDENGREESGNETEPEDDEHRYDALPVGLLPVNRALTAQNHVVMPYLDPSPQAGATAAPPYTRATSFGIAPQPVDCIRQMAQPSLSSGYLQSHYAQSQSPLAPKPNETTFGNCNLRYYQPHQSIHNFGPPRQPQLRLLHNYQEFYPSGTIPVGPRHVSSPCPPPGAQQSGPSKTYYRSIAPQTTSRAPTPNTSRPSPLQMASTPLTAVGSSSRPSTASTCPSTASLDLLGEYQIVTATHRLPKTAEKIVQNTISGTQTPSRAATESPDPLAAGVKSRSLRKQTENPTHHVPISSTVSEFDTARKVSRFMDTSGPTKSPSLPAPPTPASTALNRRPSTDIQLTADHETASTSLTVESSSFSPSGIAASASAPITVLARTGDHTFSRRSDSPLNLNIWHTLASNPSISAQQSSESKRAHSTAAAEAMAVPKVALGNRASAAAEEHTSNLTESHSMARSNSPGNFSSEALIYLVGSAQAAKSHSEPFWDSPQSPRPELVHCETSQLNSTTSSTTPDQAPAGSTPTATSQPVPSSEPYAHLPPHLRPRPEYLQGSQHEPVYDNSYQRFVANKYAIAAKGAATRRARAGLGVGNEKHLDKASATYYKPASSRRENKENVPAELAKCENCATEGKGHFRTVENGRRLCSSCALHEGRDGGRRLRSMKRGVGGVAKEREREKVVEEGSKSMPNGGLPLGVQRVLVMEGSQIRGRGMAVDGKVKGWGLDEIRPDECGTVEGSESDAEEVDLI